MPSLCVVPPGKRTPVKATRFEFRHQTLLHLLVVGLAFITYLFAPDDIVWLIVRNSTHVHLYERALFALAALFIGVGATLCTWALAYPEPDLSASLPVASDGPHGHLRYLLHFGRLLYAIGLGSLTPVPGFVILIAGEALLVFRLMRRTETPENAVRPALPAHNLVPNWKKALRQESVKWGIFVTMIIFAIVLVDRIADYLVLASFLLWLFLNLPRFSR